MPAMSAILSAHRSSSRLRLPVFLLYLFLYLSAIAGDSVAAQPMVVSAANGSALTKVI